MNNLTHTIPIQDIFKIDLSTRNVVKIAMLSAVAFVLMLVSFHITAFFPPFLKLRS